MPGVGAVKKAAAISISSKLIVLLIVTINRWEFTENVYASTKLLSYLEKLNQLYKQL